ncbi:hypothetical protein A5893_01945 [Pedobacter psychrophilus]|uniref:DUF4249 domain-containing protein n=1 Tax=Pedobacter psychrophilus TaxID=1826909 RepID=A0A179DLX0_9SPHI|nr:DUF4249 domain-containing protein [Pedobacter psychrophilus]OAQ41904.1 hypothetical protein A5893_01945 [Pedobacter psychrophilus]
MKNIIYYLSAFIILAFSSCEDVIDLNLDNSEPQIVIEANVVNNQDYQIVKISKTKKFTDNNTTEPLSGATVVVKEDGGGTYNFTQLSPGVYKSGFFIGKPTLKYTIQVSTNGKTYTATSTMPQPVTLDSLTVIELSFFNSKNKFIQVNFKDPVNIKNQYNYVISVNDSLRNAYYPEEDRFNDGKLIKNTLFTSDPELKTDDKVTIDFQCIDNNIYRYFFAITQINGNGGPPTAPSNPPSNFDNGALGYFSAHTMQLMSVKIP